VSLVAVGNWLFRTRDFLFPLAIALAFVPSPTVFSDPVLAIALGLCVAAVGQVVRAGTIGFRYIIRGGRNRRVYAEDLVTDGIFGHTRNPMYVGNLLILAGIAVASNSWICLVASVAVFTLVYVAIVAAEEHYLRDKFGPAYDAYCADVPRWLPRLRGLGATLSGMEFHWKRVVVKEYGTPFGWVSAIAVLGLIRLWPLGEDGTRRVAGELLAALVLVTAAFWLVARILKKTQRLVGD
jgi:protein-S-isoprenylcysteine O-methyltransferase Ste14